MYYPILEYTKTVQHPTFYIEETLIIQVLKNSYGEPTMSDDDVKLAILSLFNTCKTQQAYIDELVDCVNELRTPKKKFWHRRK